MFSEDEERDIFELIHCRLFQYNEKLLELDENDDMYEYIKNKSKSYKSILQKLGYGK